MKFPALVTIYLLIAVALTIWGWRRWKRSWSSLPHPPTSIGWGQHLLQALSFAFGVGALLAIAVLLLESLLDFKLSFASEASLQLIVFFGTLLWSLVRYFTLGLDAQADAPSHLNLDSGAPEITYESREAPLAMLLLGLWFLAGVAVMVWAGERSWFPPRIPSGIFLLERLGGLTLAVWLLVFFLFSVVWRAKVAEGVLEGYTLFRIRQFRYPLPSIRVSFTDVNGARALVVRPHGRPLLLLTSRASGYVELVRLVLALFPGAARYAEKPDTLFWVGAYRVLRWVCIGGVRSPGAALIGGLLGAPVALFLAMNLAPLLNSNVASAWQLQVFSFVVLFAMTLAVSANLGNFAGYALSRILEAWQPGGSFQLGRTGETCLFIFAGLFAIAVGLCFYLSAGSAGSAGLIVLAAITGVIEIFAGALLAAVYALIFFRTSLELSESGVVHFAWTGRFTALRWAELAEVVLTESQLGGYTYFRLYLAGRSGEGVGPRVKIFSDHYREPAIARMISALVEQGELEYRERRQLSQAAFEDVWVAGARARAR